MRFIAFISVIYSRWSGSHTCWGQPFRLCHLTTGRYLGLTEENGLHLVNRDKADINTSAFCIRSTKVRKNVHCTSLYFVANMLFSV